jgi:hypothetical protein
MEMLPSGLPNLIDSEEDLARFLTQGGHYNAQMAKPAAFLPSLKDHETSVSRHGFEPLERLWIIGRDATNGRNLHGVAVFKARTVGTAQLEAVADEPPHRHAAIRGWPWLDDPELQKAQQKERAIVLAVASKLLLRGN